MRQAIRKELQLFRSELAVDLARLPYVQQWPVDDLYLLADLIVQTMVTTVPDLLEAEEQGAEAVERVARDARRKLLLIVLGIPALEPLTGERVRGGDWGAWPDRCGRPR